MKSLNNKFNVLGGIGVGGLLLTGALSIMPIIPSSAHATCADGDTSGGCVTSMASMDTEVTVGTSIAIAMDSKVTMDITPSSAGSVSAVSSKVQVATNSIDGYALFMKADPELVNTSTVNDGAVVNSITNASTASTLSNMVENTYGYNISNTKLDDNALTNVTYQPMDTAGITPIRQTTSTSIGTSNTDYGYGEEYYLNLGVKVGTNLPAGTYAGTVTLSAVANPVTVRSMAGLKYMQDMTSDICSNTIEHYTKRLTDTRDGKEYWVAKLKDGNCWMTQNLALDITAEMANATGNSGLLNSNTTDIGYNSNGELIDGIKYWNADSEYPPTKTMLLPDPDTSNPASFGQGYSTPTDLTTTYSWSYGEVLSALPDQAYGACGKYGGAWSVGSTDSITEACAKQGFIDVSGSGWRSSYTLQQSTFVMPDDSEYKGFVAADPKSKTYDAHYLIGNYYQANAITVGNVATITDKGIDVQGSLCPKGWRLPVTSVSENYLPTMRDGSLDRLLSYYGYPVEKYIAKVNPSASVIANQPQNFIVNELHFVRTGNVHYRGLIYGVGGNADYWTGTTSTTSSSSQMFGLRSNRGTVNPDDSIGRLNGVAARCVAY